MDPKNRYKSILNTFKTPERAASLLAEEVIDQTKKAIDEKGRCVWAVSGGSSILKIYDALSDYKNFFGEFGKFITVTWVDERVVPHTHEKSNFGSAKNYFWNKFENVQLIPVSFKQGADQSSKAFKSALQKEGIQRGAIDVMILGMGSDGHTASLFPYNERLNEKTKDIVPVSDPSVEVERISMTYPLINSSGQIYLYFYGEEKGETIRRAMQSGDQDKYPILGIDWNKTQVYTDQAL